MANQTAEAAKEQAQEVAAEAVDQTRSVAHTAQEQAGEVVGSVKQQAAHLREEATQQASQLLHEASHQLQHQAEAQSRKLAGGLRMYGDECQALADGRPEDAPHLRPRLEQAGTRMTEMADRIDNRGMQGMLDDVQQFARSRPGMFLLGAVVAGFAIGRVVKASRQPDRQASAPAPSEHAQLEPMATAPTTQHPFGQAYGAPADLPPAVPTPPSTGAYGGPVAAGSPMAPGAAPTPQPTQPEPTLDPDTLDLRNGINDDIRRGG